tara:strand:- start:889 stop:1566 length:678 start_codon:yes stop_codon:yes gene_type:complete
MVASDYVLRLEGILPTGACVFFATLFLTVFAMGAQHSSAQAETLTTQPEPCSDGVHRFQPVILVTVGWSALYYCFLQGQAAVAFWIHKKRRDAASMKRAAAPAASERRNSDASIPFAAVKYGPRADGGLIFVMDRSVGNLLEQTPPFLIGIWLHALAASPDHAAGLGWLWLLLRACYPVAFAYPSMTPRFWGLQRCLGISWVNFITWPSYAIVWTLLYGAVRACW